MIVVEDRHFGLQDLNPEDPFSPLALAIISYIGAFLSVVCLLIVIITHLLSRFMQNVAIIYKCLYFT